MGTGESRLILSLKSECTTVIFPRANIPRRFTLTFIISLSTLKRTRSFLFRLHGGDNVQIKRYFVSFWNGVDLRYKLLKGPKIRISIAGIIISRVRDGNEISSRIDYNLHDWIFFEIYKSYLSDLIIVQREKNATIAEDESCKRQVAVSGGAPSACINKDKIVLYPGTRRDTVLRKESRGKRRNRLGSRSDWHGQISFPGEETSCIRHRRRRYKVRVPDP